jgi:hypothetical protein
MFITTNCIFFMGIPSYIGKGIVGSLKPVPDFMTGEIYLLPV